MNTNKPLYSGNCRKETWKPLPANVFQILDLYIYFPRIIFSRSWSSMIYFRHPNVNGWGYQVAAYACSDGTVIFGGDFGIMTLPERFERYLANDFCLPWKISSTTELFVRLNGNNSLIGRLPASAQQENVYAAGAFIHDVSLKAAVYRKNCNCGLCLSWVTLPILGIGRSMSLTRL